MESSYLMKVLSKYNSERVKTLYRIVWYSSFCHELNLMYLEMSKKYAVRKSEELSKALQMYENFKKSQDDVKCINTYLSMEEMNDIYTTLLCLADAMFDVIIPAVCRSQRIEKIMKRFVIFEANCRLKDFIMYEKINDKS